MGQLRCQVCKRFLGTLNGLQYCRKCDLHYSTGSRCFCVRNPADVSIKSTLEPELFIKSIKIVAQADNIDMIYVIRGLPDQSFLNNLLETGKDIKKPLGVFLFRQEVITEEHLPLLKAGIVTFTDSVRGILALSRFAQYAERRHRLPLGTSESLLPWSHPA